MRPQAHLDKHPSVPDGLRVLIVSPYPPSRLAGGPIRLQGLVTSLPPPHTVSLLAFARRGQDVPAEVQRRCDEVVIIPNERRDIAGSSKRALQIRSLLS